MTNNDIYDHDYVEMIVGAGRLSDFETWAFGAPITPSTGMIPKRWFSTIVDKWNDKHSDQTIKDMTNQQAVLAAMISMYSK